MRIAIISPFLFRMPRGIERWSANLARQLSALGDEVSLLAWAGPLSPQLPADVQVRLLPAFRYFESRWAVPFYARELRRGQFDLVIVFFAGFGEAQGIRLARRPFAVNFLVGYPAELVPHRFREFVKSGLGRRLNGVVVNSAFMVEGVEQALGCRAEIIPQGIDPLAWRRRASEATTAWRTRLGIEANEIVLLTVAALEERKGVIPIVRALPPLLAAGLAVKYVIVGDGPHRAAIARAVAALGLDGAVRLVGAQEDVLPFYNMADVFALPSYGEGFPNVLLEALAMQLPVVVSDAPPYDEAVKPEFGVTVSLPNGDALAGALLALCADPERRRAMGAAGRAHVEAHYAWQTVARRYHDYFRSQLDGPTHD